MTDKTESLLLGQSTNGWRRMEGVEQVAYMRGVVHRKMEVATQVGQMASTRRIRSIFTQMVGIALQLMGDIGRHITLFVYIFFLPRDIFGKRLCACQRHRLPLVANASQQRLRGSHQPQTTLWCIDQRNKHAGIAVARPTEELQGGGLRLALHIHATCQHQFLERAIQQMSVEIKEIDMVGCTQVATWLLRSHAQRLRHVKRQLADIC